MDWRVWKMMRLEMIAHLDENGYGELKLLIVNTGGVYDVIMVSHARVLKKVRKALGLANTTTYVRRSIFFGLPALIIHSTGDWDAAVKSFVDIVASFGTADIEPVTGGRR